LRSLKKKKKKKRKPGHERREAGTPEGIKDRDSNLGKGVYMRIPYTLTYYASLGCDEE